MALNTYTKRDEQLIVKNIIAACENIEKLSEKGYKFIMLCSGFIAHYNKGGFIAYYKDEKLKKDILRFQNQNQWSNFREGESGYDYYMQKKRIYNAICLALKNN